MREVVPFLKSYHMHALLVGQIGSRVDYAHSGS